MANSASIWRGGTSASSEASPAKSVAFNLSTTNGAATAAGLLMPSSLATTQHGCALPNMLQSGGSLMPAISDASTTASLVVTSASVLPASGPAPLLTLGSRGNTMLVSKRPNSGQSYKSQNEETTGLGGVGSESTYSSTSRLGSSTELKGVKETVMPLALVQTVENFKKHVKEERSERESIVTSSSCESFLKVQEQIAGYCRQVASAHRELQRNCLLVSKLKTDTSQELRNAEIALQTKETPIGLQYENDAPNDYFRRMVCFFEHDAQVYRQLVADAEGHLLSSGGDSTEIDKSRHDLFGCMKKMHDTFVLLAAQLHTVHEKVKAQKSQYLTYRRVMLHDGTDIFESSRQATNQGCSGMPVHAPDLTGPTPFDTGLSSHANAMMMAALTSAPAGAGVQGLSSNPHGLPPCYGMPIVALGSGTSGMTQGIGSLGGLSSGMYQPIQTQASQSGLFAATMSSASGLFGSGVPSAMTSMPFGNSSGGGLFGGVTGSGSSLGASSLAPVKPLG